MTLVHTNKGTKKGTGESAPAASGTSSPLVYRRIYDDLSSKIDRGEIAYMEQLPVLPDLCTLYSASHVTVRRALEALERDGYVRRQRGRGKGTFAVKRTSKAVLRVLLVGEGDILRNPVELCHEVFDLLAGIREAAAAQGASVQTASLTSFDTLPTPAGERGTLGYLIVAMEWGGYQQGAYLAARHGAPFVLVNPPLPGFPCVRVDMEEAAFRGVEYLTGLGHRRIAYIGGTHGAWFSPRWNGYRRALAQAGLPYDQDLVRESDGVSAEQDAAALDALLALPQPPTAVFASSDYRALHLLAHCQRKGIVVPRDLSLCGYDNIGEVEDVAPALTTVNHPRYEQGAEAVSLLLDLLAQEQLVSSGGHDGAAMADRRIAPRVVVRASCAPPPTLRP